MGFKLQFNLKFNLNLGFKLKFKKPQMSIAENNFQIVIQFYDFWKNNGTCLGLNINFCIISNEKNNHF